MASRSSTAELRAAIMNDQIPTDTINRWLSILPKSQQAYVRQSCLTATLTTVAEALEPQFSCWTTSLVGSDLKKLHILAGDEILRLLVKKIIVADDHEKIDLWTSPTLPSPDHDYKLWPRDSAGAVLVDEIGLSDLAELLRSRLLQPNEVRIRDYRIHARTWEACPEMISIREKMYFSAPDQIEPKSLENMTVQLVNLAGLTPVTLSIEHVSLPHNDDSIFNNGEHTWAPHTSIGDPRIRDAVLCFATITERDTHPCSQLRRLHLFLDRGVESYWLKNSLYRAEKLERLSLTSMDRDTSYFDRTKVVAKLSSLDLWHVLLSSSDLLAMLASSKGSLKEIKLRSVYLTDHLPWDHLLRLIADHHDGLESFELNVLGHKYEEGLAHFQTINFDRQMDRHKERLKLWMRGVQHGVPFATRLSYQGDDAAAALKIISKHARKDNLPFGRLTAE